MAAVYPAARSPLPLQTLEKGGDVCAKKARKRKMMGYKDSFTLFARGYATFPPASSPFSHSKNKYIRKKSRGNDSLMLLHKNLVASLPVVFLPRPEQALFSCPSPGDITMGRCFPSHALRRLEIINMKFIWKLLPGQSSAGYLQARAKAWAGWWYPTLLSLCSLPCMKRVGAVSALSAPRNHAVCRRVWGEGPSPAHPHPAPILLAGNPGISPVHSFLFMTFSLVPTSFFLLFFPSPPAATKGHPGMSGTPRCHNPRPSAVLSAPPNPSSEGQQSLWADSSIGIAPSIPAGSPGALGRQIVPLCASSTPRHGHIGGIIFSWPQISGIIFFLAVD